MQKVRIESPEVHKHKEWLAKSEAPRSADAERILDLGRGQLCGGELGDHLAVHEGDQLADLSELIAFQMGTLWEHLYRARAIPPRPFRSQ